MILLMRLLLIVLVAQLLWSEATEAQIPMPNPMPHYLQEECPAYKGHRATLGCAYIYEGDPLYGHAYAVKGSGPSTFWHEMGHFYMENNLTIEHKNRLEQLVPSRGGGEQYDPLEVRAETYAICAMHKLGRLKYSALRWLKNDGWAVFVGAKMLPWRRFQRACQVIWNAAGMRYEYVRPATSRG